MASIVPIQAVAAELNSGVVPHFLSAIDHNAPPVSTTVWYITNQNVDKAFHSTPVVEAMPVSSCQIRLAYTGQGTKLNKI